VESFLNIMMFLINMRPRQRIVDSNIKILSRWIDSLEGQIKKGEENQKEEALDSIVREGEIILRGKETIFTEDLLRKFWTLHPKDQYSYLERLFSILERNGRGLEKLELLAYQLQAEPKEMPTYGGFQRTLFVPGALSDRSLVNYNNQQPPKGKYDFPKKMIVVPSSHDFPLAEQYRKDNSRGVNFDLHLCANPEKEFHRLSYHFGNNVILVRIPK
jgi:hypothetical protein